MAKARAVASDPSRKMLGDAQLQWVANETQESVQAGEPQGVPASRGLACDFDFAQITLSIASHVNACRAMAG